MQSGCANNILALHGFTGCGEDFEMLRAYCPGRWRWHCPDLPGHGKNPLMPATLEAHFAFVENERRRAFGGEPCILLGYSMGGRVALHCALRTPDRFSALVLISSSPGIADAGEREKRRQSDEILVGKIISDGVSEFQLHWQNSALFSGLKKLPEEELFKIRQRRLKNSAEGLAASLRGVGTGALPELWNKISSWKKPVLVIAGGRDEKFSGIAKKMTGGGAFPYATLAIIPGAGHVTHTESPAETAAELTKFLNLGV